MTFESSGEISRPVRVWLTSCLGCGTRSLGTATSFTPWLLWAPAERADTWQNTWLKHPSLARVWKDLDLPVGGPVPEDGRVVADCAFCKPLKEVGDDPILVDPADWPPNVLKAIPSWLVHRFLSWKLW